MGAHDGTGEAIQINSDGAKPSNPSDKRKVQIQRKRELLLAGVILEGHLEEVALDLGLEAWGRFGQTIPLLVMDHSARILPCLPLPHAHRLQLST